MLKEFFSRYKHWLVIGALALVANLIIFFTLTMPKVNAESIGSNRLDNLQQQQEQLINKLEKKLSDLKRVRREKQKLQRFHQKVLGYRGEKLTSLLSERDKIARTFGVQPIRVIYGSEAINAQPLERFSMNFPLVGSYASLRFFVDTIEQSSSFFIVDKVELKGSTTEGGELSMRIVVSTFFYTPDALEEDES